MLMPALSMGAMMTMPSGMFCNAIPPAMVRASALLPEPKPTPAAMPSGKLWMAMASTKSMILLTRSVPSGWLSWSTPTRRCRWGTRRSMRLRASAPQKTPAMVISTANLPPFSREGRIRPMTAADSITPAAKLRTMSLKVWVIFLKAKPSSAPTTVAPPTPRAVNNTISIVLPRFSSQSQE